MKRGIRKKILIIAVAFILMSIFFILNSNEVHAESLSSFMNAHGAHGYNQKKIEATCTQQGMSYYYCKKCSNAKSDTIYTPALGHDYGNDVVTRAASCNADGAKQQTCKRTGCFSKVTVAIPKTNVHINEVINTATCEQSGRVVARCKNCLKEFSSQYAGALGHSYKDVVIKAASCTSAGQIKQTCTRDHCGKINYLNVQIKEHKWLNGVCTVCRNSHTGCRSTKAPTIEPATCTKDGSQYQHCDICGKVINKTTIPKGNHQWYLVKTTNSTCAKDGTANYKCNLCSETKAEVIPKTGKHTWQNGVCTVCHNAHTGCRSTKAPTIEPATCTKDGSQYQHCDICGKVINKTTIPKGNHQWYLVKTTNSTCVKDGTANYKCNLCSETKAEIIPKTGKHTWKNGFCIVCNIPDPNATTNPGTTQGGTQQGGTQQGGTSQGGTQQGGSDIPSTTEYKVFIDGIEVTHLSKIQRKVDDIITITATEGISVSSRRAYLARTNVGTKFEFKIIQKGNPDITIARSKTGEQMTVTIEITDKDLTQEEKSTVTASNKTSALSKLEFCDGSGTSAKNATLYKRDIGQSDTLFVYAFPKDGMANSVAPVITLESENPDLATAYVGIFDELKYEGRPYVGIPFQWPKGGGYNCYYYQIQTVTKGETPAEGVKIKMYVDGVYETCFNIRVSDKVWDDKIEIVFGNNNYGKSDLTPVEVLQGEIGTIGITPHYTISGKNGGNWILQDLEASVTGSCTEVVRPTDSNGNKEFTNWMWVLGISGGKAEVKITATYKNNKTGVVKTATTEDSCEIKVIPYSQFTNTQLEIAMSTVNTTFERLTNREALSSGLKDEFEKRFQDEKTIPSWREEREVGFSQNLSSAMYEISEDYSIEQIESGSTVYDLYSNLEFTELPTVHDIEGNSLDIYDELGTGMMAIAEQIKYDIIVIGDVNGDGKVTMVDLIKVIKHSIDVKKLEGVYFKAADLSEDGRVGLKDLVKMIKLIIN